MNTQEDPKTLARQRLILAVLAGQLSATQAALELGVSRKTYYEWQERALSAMLAALRDRPGGRPPDPVDPEKQQLQATVATLEQERQVLEGRLQIRTAMQDALAELQSEVPAPKKKREARAHHANRAKGSGTVEATA